MIIKNKDGEVRLIWCLLFLVGTFLLFAYLLRYIPIRIETNRLMNQGSSNSEALNNARYRFMDDPIWSSILGAIQGLFWCFIVFVIIRIIEKQVFTCEDLGLSIEYPKIWLLPLGLALGLGLYFGYFGIGRIFTQQNFIWNPPEQSFTAIIFIFLNFLANGFGEEIAFRAYFQDRLIKRHGLWQGIMVGSFAFVLLHLFVAPFTISALIASILLSATFGILYVWTRSVYLVGGIHFLFNLMPQLTDQWPSDFSLLFVNAFVLLCVTVLFILKPKPRLSEGQIK